MIQTLNNNSNPQPDFGVQASTVPIYTPTGTIINVLAPVQIMGLVPLICPTQDTRLPAFSKCDCREWTNDDCYINPVFASTTDIDPLKNDHNMFLLEYPFFYQYQWTNTNALFFLQEWDGTQWIQTTQLIDSTYGTYYNFGSLCIPNWKGFDIDWRKILIAFGEGLYRFSVISITLGSFSLLVSEPFCLKEWSCAGTDVTVRWEATMNGGRIGSIVDDQRVFEFCCQMALPVNPMTPDDPGFPLLPQPAAGGSVLWRDQLRVYAFFGREKTEYERVNVEYRNGEIIQVRNEAIQKFEYESALQPKWIHDRLKAYAFMADELYVTDYNWNNSDYEIDKKRVTCDGSYEPEYNINTRYSNVKVAFKEGFQNVIRDKCCDTQKRGPLP